MKKTVILLLAFLSFFYSESFAQKEKKKKVDPDHTNFFKPVTKETPNVGIEIQDAVAKVEYAKFRLKLANKTNDYLIFKPQESRFKLENGEYLPEDKKPIIIRPADKESKVIDAKGNGKDLHVNSYKFNLGGLYKVSTGAAAVQAPNFKLPANVNDITAGNFKIEMLQNKKETKETAVKFRVTYNGDGYGLVDPKKLGVKIESGQEFANEKNNQKAFLLTRGESDTFIALFMIPGKIADMQFANLEILWRDTFKDCTSQKMDDVELDLLLDEGLTAGKNK